MRKSYLAFLVTLLIFCALFINTSQKSVQPSWIQNPYLQIDTISIWSDDKSLFSQKNQSSKRVTFTQPYHEGVKLGYGLQNYQGNYQFYLNDDKMIVKSFKISHKNLTQTGFSLSIKTNNYEKYHIFKIQYIVVDKTLIYHLNIFNHFEVQINDKMMTNGQNSITQFQRVYNYTSLAKSQNFSNFYFGTNYGSNKIVFLLQGIESQDFYSMSSFRPTFSIQILTIETFSISLKVSQNQKTIKFLFSLIIFDRKNLQKSGFFNIESHEIQVELKQNKFFSLPKEFSSSLIVGFSELYKINKNSRLDLNQLLNLESNQQKLSEILKITIFYVKTWKCPQNSPYFDLESNLCDDQCNDYSFKNKITKLCQSCNFGCFQCQQGPNNNCTLCNQFDNRELRKGNCECMQGFYHNTNGSTVCLSCESSDIECNKCEISSNGSFICLQKKSTSLAVRLLSGCSIDDCALAVKVACVCECSQCNPGFVSTGPSCISCSISNCLTHDYVSGACACTQCMPSYVGDGSGGCLACQGYMQKCTSCTAQNLCTTCESGYVSTGPGCVSCTISNCQTLAYVGGQCVCAQCNAGLVPDINGLCVTCSSAMPSCSQCKTSTSCTTCLTGYVSTGTGCLSCVLPNCLTHGYVLGACACTLCDVGYILEANGGCSLCSTLMPSCSDCTSPISCTTCVSGYVSTGPSCLSCTIPDCATLGYAGGLCTCTQCNAGFISDGSNGCVLCSFYMASCSTCTSQISCTTCDAGYVSTGFGCLSCTISDCQTLGYVGGFCVCAQCNIGFADDGFGGCALCSNLIPSCSDCTSSSLCTTCIAGFVSTGPICLSCTIPDCAVHGYVASACACTQCNVGFTFDGLGGCRPCSVYMTACLDCSSQSICTGCDNLLHLYLNPSTDKCQSCNILGCSTCDSLTTCLTCDVANDFFPVAGPSCLKCPLIGCSDCSSLIACNTCNELAGYFINSTAQICQSCSLTGCVTCQTLTTCKVCDTVNNYGLVSDGTCKQCPFTCLCDGYVLPKYTNSTDGQQYCSTVCGDSLKRNFEQCDDGNIVDGDGCSSTCQIESAWSCSSDPAYTCCTLESSKLTLSINKILKVPNKNSMTLILEVSPKLPILTPENIQKYVTLSVTGVPLYNESRVSKPNQIIEVTYDYNQSIHGKKGSIGFSISFSQTGAPSCVISATKNITIMAQANNNLPFMFYTEEELAKQQQVAESANVLEIITYVIFFLSMIPAKIIGLQLIGVMQLAYFALAQQDNINVLLEPFMKMNEINGFNADWLTQNQQLPDQVSALGIKALFLNNCNVMLLLILIEVLTAGVLFGLSHLMSSVSQKLSSISKHLIKEGLLTLMMFNAFNIAFGVGIHFQYADKNDGSYALSSFAALLASGLIFGVCALLMFAEGKQFGEFKDKLKPTLMCQLYFVFSLGYRYALGYYIAVKNQYILSSLIIVGFAILFLLYNFVNLPFNDAYHNYRANICHCAQLVILVVTNYYDSMTENQPMEKKAYQFSGAEMQIAAIYVAVGFSAICLAYDFYKFIKAKFSSSKHSHILSSSTKKMIPNVQNNFTTQNFQISNSYQFNEVQFTKRK